ncbi:calcium uniporter protein 2, mitochondrial-like [Actinidia eriantha]|uniref:calcium uniporter protein 2, mitochondrial-like n=1 Tax=Actinidia eriantha TaxID=165200 RepID=UPI00258EEB8D|nr:calcium uniporter protein 2, mitochondrial-like [Actinidia eriantha]
MAHNRTLAHRLFNASKSWNQTLTNCRISSSSSAVQALIPPAAAKAAPDPGDDGIFRRFLQWRPIYHSAAPAPELRSLPRGDHLLEKLREMDIGRNRIRFDGLSPPAAAVAEERELTVADARKLLRVSQIEMVKSKLREVPKGNITLEEFVQICCESCGNREQGLRFAKTLDESGTVIVLGNVVFLRPDQVVKVIQDLMPAPVPHASHPSWRELEEMEKQKAVIDRKADSLVRRELWCGLGYLIVQTAAFMRLTFWELSWDVMEPICFYVTSMYFMAGYAFFLRTSKEPSFEGFFQSRFNAKQKRLMKICDFDVGRYNELRTACYPKTSSPGNAALFTYSFHNSSRIENDALH